MRLNRLYGFSFGILAVVTSAGFASADAFEDHVLMQLSCQQAPDPLASLLALQKQKRFEAADGRQMDSATCWTLKPALAIKGMSFDHVCASSEDPLLIELFPELFWRGPGTSAGDTLTLTTTQPQPSVNAWAQTNLGGAEGKFDVSDSAQVQGETAVSCTGLHLMP